MKTRLKFLMYGVFAFALTITSCEKEGAQGPTGPAGTMGEQGVAGPAGTDGQDGNANVITSSWIPVTFETFVSTEVFDIDGDLFPEDVRDSYAVLVYMKGINFADAVYQLPADFGTFNIDYAILSDNTLRVFYNEGTGTVPPAPENASVRYILIEANETSGKSSIDVLDEMKSSGVDTNDYDAVMDFLGLDY